MSGFYLTFFFLNGEGFSFLVSLVKRIFSVHAKKQSTEILILTFAGAAPPHHLKWLCYVSVHFAVLRCPCQVLSLDQSFNALLNYHRAGQEPCTQLLGHLWDARQTRQPDQQIWQEYTHRPPDHHKNTALTKIYLCIPSFCTLYFLINCLFLPFVSTEPWKKN